VLLHVVIYRVGLGFVKKKNYVHWLGEEKSRRLLRNLGLGHLDLSNNMNKKYIYKKINMHIYGFGLFLDLSLDKNNNNNK